MKEPSSNSIQFCTPEVMNNMKVGLWTMEIVEGERNKMYIDSVAASLIGCPQELDPCEIFERWMAGVDAEAIILINNALQKMEEGHKSEAQYIWHHPDGSNRTVRCGGVRDFSFKEGIRITGTHQDISEIKHIDDEWNRRRIMLMSYFNYFNSRDALAIFLVNLNDNRFDTVKSTVEIEQRMTLSREGNYTELIEEFARVFPCPNQADKILDFKNFTYLDERFKSSPMYGVQFFGESPSGAIKWYKITANRLNEEDMIISIEDRTHKVSENMILKTLSNKQIGGFIFNLDRDVVTVVKLTPFFDYLDGYTENLSIEKGVGMLCPHIDKEYRKGWMQFASMENLQSVYSTQRRADYSFKAKFAGSHIWLRASLHAVDRELSEEPSVALVFRRYSKEELEETDRQEAIKHEKDKLERDFRLIKGIATQYCTLKIVQINGHFSIVYKDMDPSFGWDSKRYNNFWDAYKALIDAHCHPEDYEKMSRFGNRQSIINLLKGRRRHIERFRFRLQDNSYVWMDMVLIRFDKSVKTELTEFAYALANVDVEVKREKEYAQALEQVRISKEESKLKTQFVNNISHDIRTPLNAVIGYSQLLTLTGDKLSEKEKEEYINYIETSGELLTMLVDDILSISDIEHDILKLKYSDTSCNQIGKKAVSCCMMRVLENVKLYFTSDFDDDYIINTDSQRVQQILINMISNSCKATTQGEIRVHCQVSSKEGFVDFIVSDTGCGVSPEKAKEIFKRFVSVDNNNSGTGHGLGLDICFQISHRMGGSIYLDQSYKGGAKFILTIPVMR